MWHAVTGAPQRWDIRISTFYLLLRSLLFCYANLAHTYSVRPLWKPSNAYGVTGIWCGGACGGGTGTTRWRGWGCGPSGMTISLLGTSGSTTPEL
jgi:hypothetical protein